MFINALRLSDDQRICDTNTDTHANNNKTAFDVLFVSHYASSMDECPVDVL